ncbi:glycoside hydrolase family 3 C-terminal domain-containing protein [Vibrio taketomensis]|uniref:glycoside hydrolase family 3 C-terminal domain-containing protein n=1 Tax=Vibrio taketomensis TaxID=2572923 RepID=UPI001E4703CA|nr:glycoside hydrolase family 3 C-terminal domain-containing protein [Vibrio taketomensis]
MIVHLVMRWLSVRIVLILWCCVGESHRRTGEARNIAELTLPAGQEQMIEAIGRTGKPLIIVQCTGRPVPSAAIERYADAQSMLAKWHSNGQCGSSNTLWY